MNSHGQEPQRPVVDQLYSFLDNRGLAASVALPPQARETQPVECPGPPDEQIH
jgi:hypothetical protein